MIYEYVTNGEVGTRGAWEYHFSFNYDLVKDAAACKVLHTEIRSLWMRNLDIRHVGVVDGNFFEAFFPGLKPSTPLPGPLIGPRLIETELRYGEYNEIFLLVQLAVCSPATEVVIEPWWLYRPQDAGYRPNIAERLAGILQEDLKKGRVERIRLWFDEDYKNTVAVGFTSEEPGKEGKWAVYQFE